MQDKYIFRKAYQKDDSLRKSYNELAGKIYELSFEDWFLNGFWGDKYIPYSLFHQDKVVANIAVSKIDLLVKRKQKHYIQLGTVMTEPEYRSQGLSRNLMEIILEEYRTCDGIFLYANQSVLDFYPRFNFLPAKEYKYTGKLSTQQAGSALKVPMLCRKDWEHFLAEKNARTPLGVVEVQNDELLMFYLTRFMKDNVFYIEQTDAYVVAETEGDTLLLHAAYGPHSAELWDICRAFGSGIRKVELTFTPKDVAGFRESELKEEDTTLFLQGEGLCEDMKIIKRFPELAHA